ncbi:MAG: cellulose biosynthesis cyclic di-GMP-binding regulatory protein BcsB [Sporomusaceae bacterium]|nr:cellulose biosynthesis cyclic di-GMP-binding regulatory protein BcsB [Sporomusaceae bacterium]
MHLLRISSILAFLVFVLCAPVNAATQVLPLSRLGYNTDITVTGAVSVYRASFPLPAGSLLPGSFLQLQLEPSSYLNPASSFTFLLNGVPVMTESAGRLQRDPHILLPLPADALNTKNLQLAIHANVYASDRICADYRRGQLFYRLRNTSAISLQFEPAPVKTIPDFFRSLYNGLAIIIPDQPTLGELTAGAWAYGILQKELPHYPIQLLRAAERDRLPHMPRLWIGSKQHLPPVLTQAGTDVHLPFANALVITGADDAALKRNLQSLPALLRLDSLPVTAVDTEQASAAAAAPKRLIRFGNNSVQEGIVRIPLDFPLYPGELATLPETLAFQLEGSYTPPQRSDYAVRLDIYFNRSLIHSELLDHSGQLRKEISLPKHLRLKSRNMLSLELRYPEIDGICDVKGPLQSAQLYHASYMSGQGRFAADMHSWDSIGMTFSRNGLILLDDPAAAEAPAIAAKLALLVNRQLPDGRYAFPEFAALAELPNSRSDYMLVAALADNLPPGLQTGLPLTGQSGETFRKSQGLRYLHPDNASSVTGQIGVYQKTPLAVFSAAHSRQALSGLLDLLNTEAGSAGFSGNILFYNGGTALTFLDSRDPEAGLPQPGPAAAVAAAWQRASSLVEQYPKLVFLTTAVLLTALLLRLYLKQLQRKRH